MVAICITAAALPARAADEPTRAVLPAKQGGRDVPAEEMRRVYDEVKTPFKYGVVLRGDDKDTLFDCPSIFRAGDTWYMAYVACVSKAPGESNPYKNKLGYETHLAESHDLLNWKPLGKILAFSDGDTWDKWQVDGGLALVDHDWNGTHEIRPFDGKYWMTYIGGAKQGYEPDPLSMGVAFTTDPTKATPWTRFAGNPILAPHQPDTREFERKTLYKSTVIWDKAESLGFPFVMFYNGKLKNGYERIGMAVSKDMTTWQRYGIEPVVANGEAKKNGMSGDPQIVRIGDLWVMFYFGAGWGPKAFDTFACSYDLVRWTKWDGPKLIEPSETWDKTYAHKPWVIKHEGIVYHFYCAVGEEGRVIALATSKDLREKASSAK
jgi:predicted GH43/DUF377 family glycosyl hydrolase